MEQNNRHYTALELDKILQILAEETACEDAAKAAAECRPATELEEVRFLLRQTSDAHMLTGRFGSPGFGGLHNMTTALRRAQAGGILTMGDLLHIAQLLHTMRSLVEWRKHSEGVQTCLDGNFDALAPNKYLEDKIFTAIVSEDEMADHASPELADIRRKMRNAAGRVREQLDHMIRSAAYQKYLQDAIVTLRGGRYVVPVKSEFRNEVPGLVHDTSASGATVFIEPMAVVEANNEIKVLASREEAEIERILAAFSAEAGMFADDIIRGYEQAVCLNVIFAKARLAYRMKATLPEVNDAGRIFLKNARHPLIDPQKVVPTTIELGERYDTLVVTGPNTGGKTVSIKTVGLLTLMAMCGLLLPVSDGSKISVFRHVLADIGDEQSIEQSLSTFSAHMTHIIEIMKEADENSLVLLDELGAGTDPVEGAALATSILERLRCAGARIAATTHYAELKAYALQTDGVENACCEFDVATLRPTYRLLIGVPGRSNAFAISERLGMEHDVVERARELVSTEDARFEDVVQKLEESRHALEEERAHEMELRAAAQQAEEENRRQRQKLEEERERELERARTEARQLVSRIRAQAQALMDEIDDLRKNKAHADAAAAKQKLRAGVRALEETADPVAERKQEDYTLPRPLKEGDNVLIYDIDKKGVVLAPADSSGRVLVQAGIIKTKVPVQNLRLLRETAPAVLKRSGVRTVRSKATAPVQTQVDLRGMTVIDALITLDQFIDAALLSGVNLITIIHGKGTGALRSAVHQHLKAHPSIRTFRLGVYGEGETGVTIAELK